MGLRNVNMNQMEMLLLGQADQHGTQVKRAIGNVESKNRTWISEMLKIDAHGFAGEQVERDGITAEGINHQDVKFLRIAGGEFPIEGDTTIADHNFGLSGSVIQ